MHKKHNEQAKTAGYMAGRFFILVVIAILTWIVPSGSFDYETIDIDGTARKVAIAGSYHEISKSEVSATGLLGLFASLYEGCVSAADIIFVIMTCAATFGVIVKTGAFHAFIGRVVQKNGSRSLILIPVLMLVFGLGGSLFGMLSEFYGFYPLIVGLMMALGYDAMTGFATIALWRIYRVYGRDAEPVYRSRCAVHCRCAAIFWHRLPRSLLCRADGSSSGISDAVCTQGAPEAGAFGGLWRFVYALV